MTYAEAVMVRKKRRPTAGSRYVELLANKYLLTKHFKPEVILGNDDEWADINKELI